ncbi:MAG: metallophosphoesterase [Bdellovibrionales bacterium]|nr:metallophosphoesterase [Bdellovibrionales bacterium]
MSSHYKVVFYIYFSLGLITHLFLAALTKDLLITLAELWINLSEQQHFLINLSTIAISIVANLWGVYTAVKGPLIKKVNVPIQNYYPELADFKIVQISDLHVGPIIKKNYVHNVVEKVNSLNPDLIAITGDLADGKVSHLVEDLEPLMNLKSTFGIYYVSGNHEYYWNIDEWETKVKDLGMKILNNNGERLHLTSNHSLWIGGVPDYSAHTIRAGDFSSPNHAFSKDQKQDFLNILLAHQPKSCLEAFDAGFDLMLCGHTHAGQFFPFSQVVGWFNPYLRGLNLHKDKLWVYVNQGTGFWGPPTRLWVPSEITCIKFIEKP